MLLPHTAATLHAHGHLLLPHVIRHRRIHARFIGMREMQLGGYARRRQQLRKQVSRHAPHAGAARCADALTWSRAESNTCWGGDWPTFAACSGATSPPPPPPAAAPPAVAAAEDDDCRAGAAESLSERRLRCCSLAGDFIGLSTPPRPELLRRYMHRVSR